MEKEIRTWTVTLADGTKLEKLTLNNGANTFHSPTEITEDTFDGKLSEVHIAASDGDMTGCAYPDTLHDAELVQIMQPADTPDGTWQFILREIPEDEVAKAKAEKRFTSLESANEDIILMMADLIGG
nr:MAG TPA: hypothetical protein [Caudoviricetes sp.]DAH49326.1 MAG TPA: hypothetical protein [Caudoviricetes sp.]DAM64365.1 MAG TPA: hypothetical protein [Caudoviricetes sp.]